MEHYTFRASLRLSRNYNSIEVSAEYGRDLKPKETTERMIEDVTKTVWEKLEREAARADEVLNSTKKG